MRNLMLAGLAAAAAFATTPAKAQTGAAPQASTSELVGAFDQKLARGEAIVAEIGAMHARDQFLRQLIIEGFRNEMSAETRHAYIDGTRRHFDRIDGANTVRIQAILDAMSWEELTALSPRAAEQAFSLISHSNDVAFKRRMIAVFEPLARAGRMPGERVALLVDDVAIDEGRLQVYGTNFECVGGQHRPRPTEDMDRLNLRRAALGMNTIEESTETMRQMYGACPAN